MSAADFTHVGAGISLIPFAGDPVGAGEGDIWYNSVLMRVRKFDGGVASDVSTPALNGHATSIYVSKSGNNSTGNGSFNQPFLTVGRANTAAALLSPSASNIVTISMDSGFYAELPGFTFLDFCSYVTSTASACGIYIPGYYFYTSAANATAGAVYTDGTNSFTVLFTVSGALALQTSGPVAPVSSSGTLTLTSGTGDSTITYSAYNTCLPITVNPSNGSRIFLTGIVTATSTATVAGSDFIYIDGNVGGAGEVITWTTGQIVGNVTVTGQGSSNTTLAMNTQSAVFGGSFVNVTNAVLSVNQSGVFQNISLSQTNSAFNAGVTFLGSSVYCALDISSVGGSGNATFNLFSSGGYIYGMTIEDTSSQIQVDADSYDIIAGTTPTFNGGSSISQIVLTSGSTGIANNSNFPGRSVTDVINLIGAGQPQSVHAVVIYVSQFGGNDSTGNGSFAQPFQTIGRANILAASLTPSLSNIITIQIDTGFYSENPGFTFLDFCNYIMAGGVETGGVYTSDSSAITVSPAANSQIQIVNINIGGTNIQGAGNMPFNYIDTSAGPFQTIGLYGSGFTGTVTVTGAASGLTQIQLDNESFLYDPNNIGVTITDATVAIANASGIYSPAIVNANTTGASLNSNGGVIRGDVTLNGTGSFLAEGNWFGTSAQFIGVTINGTNAELIGDAISLPNTGNITFSGGAVIGTNFRLVTYGTQINNDSNWSGQSVTDAFNSIYSLIQPVTNGASVAGNLTILGNGQDGGGFNITGTSGTLNFDVAGQTWLNYNQGNSDLQIKGNVQFSPGTNGGGFDVGQQIITSVKQLQTSTSTPPTPGAGSSAGSGAGAAIQGGSTDLAGNAQITTGTGSSAGQLFTLTYGTPYPNASFVTLTATSSAGALLGLYVNASTSGFSINCANAPADGTSYSVNYHVIGF